MSFLGLGFDPGTANYFRRYVEGDFDRLLLERHQVDERQPLLSQVGSSQGSASDRAQFVQNRHHAARSLVFGSFCLLCMFMGFFSAYVFLTVYFWVAGLFVLSEDFSGGAFQCPKIGSWLALVLLLPVLNGVLLRKLCSPECGQVVGWLLSCGLIVLGTGWMLTGAECSAKDPHLYNFVQAYLLFLSISWLLLLCVPLLGLLVLVLGMRYGIFQEHSGADPKIMHALETVTFDKAISCENGNAAKGLLAAECCVCCEPFGPDLAIKRTPCQHVFHEACLEKWLKVTVSCPVCRSNLQQALQQKDEEAAHDDSKR